MHSKKVRSVASDYLFSNLIPLFSHFYNILVKIALNPVDLI